ncbi:hypothetical protein ENKNEFLB_01975 [Nocardioides aquaticus]|uniref:Uncharacterized protein n=1 Tax=Nocardioides aquaticus TaxID=160826 RepID=A0ABX8EKG9_9ACTN|nr:hypothetical protein [Nocardioides aquaticus]QVT79592.1 hypothetical protein ENKNEFLB_01975 [Nocardioides aquaticus]
MNLTTRKILAAAAFAAFAGSTLAAAPAQAADGVSVGSSAKGSSHTDARSWR